MPPLDYTLIKRVARESGNSINNLLALAPQNDPFYVGTKGQRLKGEWFAKIYEAMGSPPRCHVRRVHYWLVTTNAVACPDGKPYENTERCWYLLTMAAKYARYLGLVPMENIIDRRNPDPIIHAHHWQHVAPSSVRDSIDEDSIIDSIVDQFYCFNPCQTQAYMIECWAEKSTMNDVLEPVCRQYGMNLVTGLGELSITAVHLLARRIVECRKPVRILYISDFDPAGECMPVSVARKIEYFVRTHNLSANVKLIPLMLTASQCQTYNLPRTPIKETEKRKEGFEQRHGIGATELDAMEALHPGEMRRLIERAISPYFDVQAWSEAVRKNREVKEHVRKYLVGGECEACNGSGVTTPDIDSGDPEEWDCKECAGTGSIPGKVGTDIMSALDTSDYDSYKPPQADENDNDDEPVSASASGVSWLYDSSLEYVDQIVRYREHKQQTGANADDSSNDREDE